jgi:integrase
MKADALAWLSVTETDILRGGWIDPNAGKVTFKDYAERWRAIQVHRRGTASQIETNLRRHVYPRLGGRPIGSIRPSEIQAAVKAMTTGEGGLKPLAPATVEVIYQWTATVFKAAVNDRVVASSPCRGIRLPEVFETAVVPLPMETVKQLIDAVRPRYRALIVLGAGTGVRLSEALGLTNDRIDWIRRIVKIDRQLVGVNRGGVPIFGPVKDRKNRPRTIPLAQVVVDELAAHVASFGLGPEGVLFTTTSGGVLRQSVFSDFVWIPAARPLGIQEGDGYHQLRHFFASVLIKAGESVKVVQERLGHTSAQMTLDIYSHLWPEDEDETRAAVDGALGYRARSAHADTPET